MRLGELLIHTGVLTAQQLDAALRQQVVYGGRLGTNLIELGYATEAHIAHALARLLQVPAALRKHFEGSTTLARERISRELAARFAAYPIAFAESRGGRRLVTCMRNPRDSDALRALTQSAGIQVLPSVAAEALIFYYLERGYGIRRQERYRQIQPGDAAPLPDAGSDRFPATSQAPTIEDGAVDIDIDEVEDEQQMPALQLVDLDDVDVPRDFSHYDYGAPGRPGTASAGPSSPNAANPERQTLPSLRSPPEADATPMVETTRTFRPVKDDRELSAAEAVREIAAAGDREEIADAVVAFLRARFGAGLMVIAKDGVALGHAGCGGRFTSATVETILVPLSAPSMFETAYRTKTLFRGMAPPEGKSIQDRFFKLFALDAPPAELVVAPVTLRERVVCLIYAHRAPGGPLANDAVFELEQVTNAVADGYLRLIRRAKQR